MGNSFTLSLSNIPNAQGPKITVAEKANLLLSPVEAADCTSDKGTAADVRACALSAGTESSVTEVCAATVLADIHSKHVEVAGSMV